MKLMEYVDSKADLLILFVGSRQQKTNSMVLQNARNLMEKILKGTRQMKDIITEKTKEKWQGKRMCSLDRKLVGNGQQY
jgi:transcription termination factor NusB